MRRIQVAVRHPRERNAAGPRNRRIQRCRLYIGTHVQLRPATLTHGWCRTVRLEVARHVTAVGPGCVPRGLTDDLNRHRSGGRHGRRLRLSRPTGENQEPEPENPACNLDVPHLPYLTQTLKTAHASCDPDIGINRILTLGKMSEIGNGTIWSRFAEYNRRRKLGCFSLEANLIRAKLTSPRVGFFVFIPNLSG